MKQLIDAVRAAAIKELYHDEKSGWTMVFCFPEQFIGFSGHFPNAPVLPAIVQILAAQVVAEKASEKPLRLYSITRAKFHVKIKPGDHVVVSCREGSTDSSGATMAAKIVVADQLASSFSMYFTHEEEE